MLIMTAKVDKTKILLALGAVIVTIVLIVSMFGGEGSVSAPTGPDLTADTNEARVKFLENLGWEVSTSPTESMQVRIPRESSEVFTRYNTLQKNQGFDLTEFAGKTVMRYVYQVNNFPGATEPVYATLLVSQDKIIGGDITDTAPGGKIHGILKSAGTQG